VKIDFGLSVGVERARGADDVRACAGLLSELARQHPALEKVRRPASATDARSFELELTEIFYDTLDADDERDGHQALARWVGRAIPPDEDIVARFMPTNPGDPSAPVGVPGRFTMAMSQREGPVQPRDFGTDDYEVADPTNPDSSWAPGMELRAKLDKQIGAQIAEARLAELPTAQPGAQAEPRTMVQADVESPTDVPTAPGHLPAAVDDPTPLIDADPGVDDTAIVPPPNASYAVPPTVPSVRPFGGRLIWFLVGFTLTLALLLVQRWLRTFG
jgi:hypothetical protein